MKATEILPRIDAVIAEYGLTPTKFGMEAIGDPNLVRDLRKDNRELRSATVDKILAFIESLPERAA